MIYNMIIYTYIIDMDPCHMHLRQNGGSCTRYQSQAKCQCRTPYGGKYCEGKTKEQRVRNSFHTKAPIHKIQLKFVFILVFIFRQKKMFATRIRAKMADRAKVSMALQCVFVQRNTKGRCATVSKR